MIRQFYVSFVAILFLAACSGTNESSRDQNAQKKVFRYNQAEGLSSLDPAFARNQANIWAISQIYNGLFELSKDLYTVPDLADTWEISEDGLTYTINIKKGIYFHDNDVFPKGKGRELKAQDFVYSFKRLVDPKTASTGAWIFNDKVKTDKTGKIAEDWIVADGDYTLKITLSKPFGPFLEILTMPYTFVVPQEAVEKWGKDYRVHPVGTGPFVFRSWEEGKDMALLKNENYWKKDENGKQLPYLDAIQVSFISDKNQELLTFQQKKIDFLSGIEANSVDQILNKDGSIKKEFAGKFVVQKIPYLNTEYIGLMVDPSKYSDQKHPLLNKKFRQALNYAINREEMVSFLLNNLGTPGTSGIIPPAIPAFDPEKVKGYNYDPKKAEELLKEAGFGEGQNIPEMTLHTNVQYKSIMEYLQKQWAAIGVKFKVEVNQASAHQELVDNSRAQYFRASWLGDYPDAENYLSIFYSKNFSPGGPNKTHFKNEKFDELYEKARLEQDPFKRFDIYHEMDAILVEEAPVIVLYYDEVLRLTQNNVVGLDPNPMNVIKLEKADFMTSEVVQQ